MNTKEPIPQCLILSQLRRKFLVCGATSLPEIGKRSHFLRSKTEYLTFDGVHVFQPEFFPCGDVKKFHLVNSQELEIVFTQLFREWKPFFDLAKRFPELAEIIKEGQRYD